MGTTSVEMEPNPHELDLGVSVHIHPRLIIVLWLACLLILQPILNLSDCVLRNNIVLDSEISRSRVRASLVKFRVSLHRHFLLSPPGPVYIVRGPVSSMASKPMKEAHDFLHS